MGIAHFRLCTGLTRGKFKELVDTGEIEIRFVDGRREVDLQSWFRCLCNPALWRKATGEAEALPDRKRNANLTRQGAAAP